MQSCRSCLVSLHACLGSSVACMCVLTSDVEQYILLLSPWLRISSNSEQREMGSWCKTYSYSYYPYRHASQTCGRRHELVAAWSDSRQPEKGCDVDEIEWSGPGQGTARGRAMPMAQCWMVVGWRGVMGRGRWGGMGMAWGRAGRGGTGGHTSQPARVCTSCRPKVSWRALRPPRIHTYGWLWARQWATIC